MHAVAVPRECAGPAAPLHPMLYFHFYAGGRAHIYIVGVSAYYLLLPSTTWGQGRQPSSSRSECFGCFGDSDVV